MKKACTLLFAGFFLIYALVPLYAYTGYTKVPEYLCEIGVKLYNQGRYAEALQEFKRALVAYPDYPLAQKYIDLIEGRAPEETSVLKPFEWGKVETRVFEAPEIMPEPEITGPLPPPVVSSFTEKEVKEPSLKPEIIPKKKVVKKAALADEPVPQKIVQITILKLDESLGSILQPINLEQGRSIIISGSNIRRFLVTQPEVFDIEKKNSNELLLTAKGLGYTYVHIWDDNGRWTTEFLGVFPKPEAPAYEEAMRQEEEAGRSFKLRYNLDWSSFESGRRINDLERSSYSWGHHLKLTGENPYGDLDSALSVRKFYRSRPDLTYFTAGLTNGEIGPFKGFNLRGFDYSAGFSNFAFSGANLRGGMLNSRAFSDKLNYTAFWGREGGGRYGNLSPNLTKAKHLFLDGFNLNYSPGQSQNYKFGIVHGWGRDRENFLNPYGYDLISQLNFKKLHMGYEIANDSETFAHLFNTAYNWPKFGFNAELRNVDKDFLSITGRGWRQGEIGGLLGLRYNPTEKIGVNTHLDIYRDRLFPAAENPGRLNEDFGLNVGYSANPLTSVNLNYSLQNALGRVSQSRYQNTSASLNRKVKIKKDIYTYVNYNHQDSQNFSAPSADYINDRLHSGFRFGLIGDLNYYMNKEINLVQEKFFGTISHPHVLETGLDWAGQFGKTPFYGNFRFSFRDEENTLSNLSFLAGEDYVEGYSELSYKPSDDTQLYGSWRMRNVWIENPNTSKRIEMNFNAGMRCLWDTKMRWESVGSIEGYVFKDFNSDGLRQRDEPPVEGAKVWLGKDKFQATDIFGYYKFKGIKARKAYISFDTATLPAGYVLTVPLTQEAAIAHRRTIRIDFGIVSHSEIAGYIFEDKDGDSQYSTSDAGLPGVTVALEDGKTTTTNASGRYSFPGTSAGEHTLTININTIPVYYLPQAPLKKEITLVEGVTYLYNVPLKKIQQ